MTWPKEESAGLRTTEASAKLHATTSTDAAMMRPSRTIRARPNHRVGVGMVSSAAMAKGTSPRNPTSASDGNGTSSLRNSSK